MFCPKPSGADFFTSSEKFFGNGISLYYKFQTDQHEKIICRNIFYTTGHKEHTTTQHFLGTTNSIPLVFKTNNTLTMALTCNGNVGIGTSSPVSNLHIHQMERPSCGTSIPGGGITTGTVMVPRSAIQLTNLQIGASSGRGFIIELPNNSLLMKNRENGLIKLFSSSNGGITISPGGKVTIGGLYSYNANSPHQLFVDGSMCVSGALHAANVEGGMSVSGGMSVTHTSSADLGYGIKASVDRDLTKAIAVTHPAHGEVFRVMGNGTAYAKYLVSNQVKVSLSANSIFEWPDYVFSPDHKLMPLQEVERFVKTNLHLPEIPSGQEILENGLDVAEMNALLLKKVEELTLYIIELEKRIREMEKKGGGE